jgi:hypothetical protein
MFCVLKDVFRIAPIVKDAQRSPSDDESDAEGSRDAQLAKCKQSFGFIKLIVEAASRSKDAQDQLLRTYTKTLAGAPYLRELVKGGRKKSKELAGILDDVC